MRKVLFTCILAIFALTAAHADSISLVLSNPAPAAAPGDTIAYIATVSASSTNTGAIYLNADSFNVSGSALLDDSGYLNNFPLSLNPGDTFTGTLFTLALPANRIAAYAGSFSMLGGSTSASYDVLGTQSFAATATPEPSSLLLMLTGTIGGIATWKASRRRPNPVTIPSGSPHIEF